MLEHMPALAGMGLENHSELNVCACVCESEAERAHTTFLSANKLQAHDLIMIIEMIRYNLM